MKIRHPDEIRSVTDELEWKTFEIGFREREHA